MPPSLEGGVDEEKGGGGGWGPSGIGVCVRLCRSLLALHSYARGPVFNHLYVNRWCQRVNGSIKTTAGPRGESREALSPELGPPRCLPSEEGPQPDCHPL